MVYKHCLDGNLEDRRYRLTDRNARNLGKADTVLLGGIMMVYYGALCSAGTQWDSMPPVIVAGVGLNRRISIDWVRPDMTSRQKSRTTRRRLDHRSVPQS